MTLTLKRSVFAADGIWGALYAGSVRLCLTLEHAYANGDGSFSPKLPAGTFTCVRGPHRLYGMIASFATFEITGVPGHEGILFHAGNYNKDSDGCVLLGCGVSRLSEGDHMLDLSRKAFADFMEYANAVNQFTLVVEDAA